MDLDAEDDVLDDDELIEMDTEKLEIDKVLASMTNGTSTETDVPVPPDLIADEELEDPSEAELQSAAELLTGSGLLGLGANVDLGDNKASSNASEKSPNKITSAKKSRELSFRDLEDDDEDDGSEIPPPLEAEDQEDQVQGLESYSDMEDDEEAEFTLTSKTEGSFGRVWELNEDTYVTITEPGQTYAYELDEEDSDDQEMSTLRRGAQGGWGSGLQNDAKNKYAPGSREWIARRSYDLLANATAREMKLWTKRQSSPPPDINTLYPDYSKPQAILEFGNDLLLGSENSAEKSGVSGNAQARSALERAVKFPCSFKFKVEGFGEGLIDSLIADVQRVLKKTLPRSNFHEEPAGRYTRIVFAVEVEAASHVTDLYDAFRQNSLVKFSYGVKAQPPTELFDTVRNLTEDIVAVEMMRTEVSTNDDRSDAGTMAVEGLGCCGSCKIHCAWRWPEGDNGSGVRKSAPIVERLKPDGVEAYVNYCCSALLTFTRGNDACSGWRWKSHTERNLRRSEVARLNAYVCLRKRTSAWCFSALCNLDTGNGARVRTSRFSARLPYFCLVILINEFGTSQRCHCCCNPFNNDIQL
eukprot:IDg10825t1